MAGRAVDVVSLLAAHDDSLIHGDRERLDVLARGVLAFVEGRIFVERAARDGAFHRLPLAAAVGEEIARALRLVFRLILHVEPRAARCRQAQARRARTDRDESAILIIAPLPRSLPAPGSPEIRPSACRSNFGSSDSMHRKNLLREALANRSTLNTG